MIINNNKKKKNYSKEISKQRNEINKSRMLEFEL